MKKIIYLFILIIFTHCSIVKITAMPIYSTDISKIENYIYGFDYTNDKIDKRIERLEKTIYGKISTGEVSQRMKKLSADIIADKIGAEITPSKDTLSDEYENIADDSVEYPLIDEIEQKLFNQTYKNRDFHTRIVTIERKLFGKIYDIEDYSTRMERIKNKIMPEIIATNKTGEYKNNGDYISSRELSGLNKNRFSLSDNYGQKNYKNSFSNYEEQDDISYNSDSSDLQNELSELEYQTFGAEFSNEDTKTRLKRLNSVNKAKKSANKYDSQKFQQKMSVAMEIGAMILMILAMVL